jgi:hypothetical protein
MTTDARTIERNAEAGVRPYRVVDPMDGTGRMTVRTPAGDERTVVDCLDEIVDSRLSGLSRGETLRLELSPTAQGDGYVAARVLSGSSSLV